MARETGTTVFLKRRRRSVSRWAGALLVSSLAHTARAEVPPAPDARGREFRVDFSARHLAVDAELGELLLTGDVVVTVGRYRLSGERVRMQRGPRGIAVEGGGDIAFCSCDDPPITLGYRSVTIAPPSDVLVERAVLRAGSLPIFWLPYLWLRSPDRLAAIFPSAEWRGDDGLLIGSGIHVPFDANQGRPALRALDLAAAGYVDGGVRLDLRLLTPQSTSFVRWDHLGGSALMVDAHAASTGETAAIWAYDVDASRGVRGRTSLTALESAARRYDHARLGVARAESVLFGAGLAADGVRGAGLTEPLNVGPFAEVATGGALGQATSLSFELGAASALAAGEPRARNGETRGVERFVLESAQLLGPALARVAAFEQGELDSGPQLAAAKLRLGVGAALGLPLVRRFTHFVHLIEPSVAARVERQYWDSEGASLLVATAGLTTAFGLGRRGGGGTLRLAGGLAGAPRELEPIALATLSHDQRLIGGRLVARAEPDSRSAEAVARIRLGARGGTSVNAYTAARTAAAPDLARASAPGEILPRWHELGALDAAGLTSGGDVTLAIGVVSFGAGADFDLNDPSAADRPLGVRSFARYRHSCGCFAVAALGSARRGRGGFDAGLSIDLMP